MKKKPSKTEEKKLAHFQHHTADVSSTAKIGKETKIWHYVHIREDVKIGSNCVIGKNVYIDFQVKIGNNVKIQNNVSLFHGITIEHGVFVGPHVCFTNDKVPRATNVDGSAKKGGDWVVAKTVVKKGASIGANSTILPGITIGSYAMIGAGSVVTKDVGDYDLVYGNPAKVSGKVDKAGNIVSKIDSKINSRRKK
ncbi:MAG: acyltransferase [Candidatus Berkelbacteria bacterium]|nr:acyltransferase [Candidatus Berkelbacteria bacterium]